MSTTSAASILLASILSTSEKLAPSPQSPTPPPRKKACRCRVDDDPPPPANTMLDMVSDAREDMYVTQKMWISRIAKVMPYGEKTRAEEVAYALDFIQTQLSFLIESYADEDDLVISKMLNNTELAYICYIAEKCAHVKSRLCLKTTLQWLGAVHVVFVSMVYLEALESASIFRLTLYKDILNVPAPKLSFSVMTITCMCGDEIARYQLDESVQKEFTNGAIVEANSGTYF